MKIKFVVCAFLLSFLLVLFGPVQAQDGVQKPYVTCDPVEDRNDYITDFELWFNNTESNNVMTILTEPEQINATHKKIVWSLHNLNATGHFQAKARSVNTEWGKHSDWSNTIEFSKPGDGDMPSCILRKED
jgi:hypothetical protein